MRPQQWVKNLFVLAPVLFGRKLTDSDAVIQAGLAFTSFCLLSSACYLLNDVLDAQHDQAHPKKRHRPIASGSLSVGAALIVAVILAGAGLTLSWLVGFAFFLLLAGYGGMTALYCLGLKRVMILEGMIVASGFVLRVAGGSLAIQVQPSHWLILCTFLLALYLVFAKRKQELLLLATDAGQHRHVLGEYTASYLDKVTSILASATIISYAIYTVAPETVNRFGTHHLIYGTIFVLYGLLRFLALTQDSRKGDDPNKILVSDKPLWLAIVGWGLFNTCVVYRSHLLDLYDQFR